MCKKILLSLLGITFILILFHVKIHERYWLIKNRNRVFYASVSGENNRLYSNQEAEFGIIPDIMQRVREKYGIDIRCTRGGGDFTADSFLPEEEDEFYFTDPYLNIGLYLYTREEIRSFKEVKGMKVITPGLERGLTERLGIDEVRGFSTLEEEIEEFRRGGYQGIILDGEAVKETDIKSLLRGMHKTPFPADYDIRVRMKVPRDRGYLFHILRSTLRDLERSGELRRIITSNSIRVERKNLRFTPEEREWLKKKGRLRVRGSEDLTLLTTPGALNFKEGAASFFIAGFSELIGIPLEIVNEDPDFILGEAGRELRGYRYTQPVYEYNVAVYSQNIRGIDTLTNLEGKRIGVLEGLREESYLRENIELGVVAAFKSFKELTAAMKRGEIDYFVMRGDLGDFYLQSNNLNDIHRVGTIRRITSRIGVPEESRELYSILSKALSLRRSTIEMEKMRRKIQASPVLLEVRLRTLTLWGAGGILFLLYLIFLVAQVRHKNKYLQERNFELEKNRSLILAITRVLEKSNEYNDEDTGEHINRVALYSELLAKLGGCSPEFVSDIRRFASLHDVGKVGISDSILKKRGRLTPEEFQKMKTHVVVGYELVREARLGSMAENIVRFHHERWSGGGYMDDLQGEEIPLEARIVALVDVYDALRQERSYKPGFSHEKALEIIEEERGSHFDPALTDIFIKNHLKFQEIYKKHQ